MSAFSNLMKRARAAGAVDADFYVDLVQAVDLGTETESGITGTERSWTCAIMAGNEGFACEGVGRTGEEAFSQAVELLERERRIDAAAKGNVP